MRIVSSAEMRNLDHLAEKEYLIDANILMENAGRAAVGILFEKYPDAGHSSEILVFAGKGNNAGDAFVVARRLLCLERKVRVFHLFPESSYQGSARRNFEILKNMKARMTHLERPADLEDFFKNSSNRYLVVDGILGTGLKGDLQGIFYDVVEIINKYVHDIVALDIPSGVDGDTGAIRGTSIQATLTVSFGFPKLGHFLPPGAGKRGELVNVDISLLPQFRREGDKFLLMKNPMRDLLVDRDRYGHKNAFGHTLLIGGSPGRLGALNMSAKACHKMGTGLVTAATWQDTMEALLFRLSDETMAIPVPLQVSEIERFKTELQHYDSIVIGPGLGTRKEGKDLFVNLFKVYNGPVVIDADGLNIIAEYGLFDLLRARKAPTVLTPHPGEMARLLKKPKEEILAQPVESLKAAVELTHSIVLLKGAATLIASVDDVTYLNHYPNDGMATAGSGDVLAGMIGGLLGQKMDPFQATLLGVYLHSLAGDFASKQCGHRSMTAPDIIENIGNAFKDLKEKKEPSFPEEGKAYLL